MITVKLLPGYNAEKPLKKASHAALKCYQAESPRWGKIIDVEGRVFKTGHHTTLEHTSFTFDIEGIAVGDITFGMHLVNPFYNSDQRSGRFCAKMFLEPNFEEIEKYVHSFWPEIGKNKLREILNYVKKGVGIYHQNIQKATERVGKFILSERPFAKEGYIRQNSPKIAQEQMRMFIPIIFPTGFDFTIDLITLVSMYQSAWSPSTKYVLRQMVERVLRKFPELGFMFDSNLESQWKNKIPSEDSVKIKYKPRLKILDIFGAEDFVLPISKIMHPVDLLHFLPEMMDNSTGGIRTEIEISTATMGQDQRHRTIGRSEPKFTGSFYLPPILKEMRLKKEALELMKNWIIISKGIPETLAMILAPYGAMVTYKKRGSFNAIAHEQGKRLCWCAQEEIYHLGRLFRLAIGAKGRKYKKLLQIFEPPCYKTGKCAEGGRYCGRDVKIRKGGDYFPERRI